jgi:hypothetical protein
MVKQQKSNKCITKYCRGKRAKGHKRCPKCRIRAWRARYPCKAAYHRKKCNAKNRGIEFKLTYKQFEMVWRPGMVIDRKDATKGYVIGNIEMLTPLDNTIKAVTIDRWIKNEIEAPF